MIYYEVAYVFFFNLRSVSIYLVQEVEIFSPHRNAINYSNRLRRNTGIICAEAIDKSDINLWIKDIMRSINLTDNIQLTFMYESFYRYTQNKTRLVQIHSFKITFFISLIEFKYLQHNSQWMRMMLVKKKKIIITRTFSK